MTSLRYLGRDLAALVLPPSKARFTIGSGACDLVIPRTVSTKVSGFHAQIERHGSGLLVHDQQSKNGTFRSRTTPRVATASVQAGESFWLGDVGLLAMDDDLDVLRPRLARSLGLEQHVPIDRGLGLIAAGGALALVGPAGLGEVELAKAIHAASTHRNNFFLHVDAEPLPSLAHSFGGTVLLELDQLKRVPATYLVTLFDTARGLRPIVVARSDRTLQRHLDHYRTEVVTLMPLAERPNDIARLLAMHWIEELHTGRRVEELARGVAAIGRHAWRRNLAELYEQSPRLLAYLEHGTLRAAAAALGIKHQTLAAHFKRIGFPIVERMERWP